MTNYDAIDYIDDGYASKCNELLDAIYFEDIDRIISSFSSGYDINQEIGNITPLIFAIEQKNIDVVRTLIFLGADLNQTIYLIGGRRSSPITTAFAHPEILKLLIQSGADVNQKLYRRITALHVAASRGFFGMEDTHEALNILLESGAEVDAKDLDGNTPFHCAAIFKNEKSIAMLLDRGANIHQSNDEKRNSLYYLYSSCNINVLKELVVRKIPLNDPSCKFNALHHACMQNGLSLKNKMILIRWLVEEQKMNVNQYSVESTDRAIYSTLTAFGYAVYAQKYHEEDFTILEYLLDAGANINDPCMISQYFKPSHQHIGFKSILKWANNYTRDIPSYVIDWLIERGAK